MIFKEIQMQNFKPYYQTESIEFDLEDPRPLTLVRAQNDLGKTTIIEAIQYCLYGFDVSESQQARNQCINRKAAVEGHDRTSVTLHVRHDDESYKIIRGHHFDQVTDPNNREAKNRFMQITVAPGTENEEVFIDTQEEDEFGDGEDFVTDLLPKQTVQFFMFDGDRIDDFANELQKSSDKVKNAIELILGIREIQNAIQDLDNIAISHYESEYNDANSDAKEYRNKKKERQEVSEKVEELEKKLEDLEDQIDEAESERSRIQQELAEVENLEEKYRQLGESRAELYGLDEVIDAKELLDDTTIEDLKEEGSIVEKMKQIRRKQQEVYSRLGPALALFAGELLRNELPDESTAIPEAVREILRERPDECLVCGQPFDVDVEVEADGGSECTVCGRPLVVTRDDLHTRLEEVTQDVTDEARRLANTVEDLEEVEDQLDLSKRTVKTEFSSLKDQYSKLQAREEKLKTRISRLDNELENAMDETERQSLRDRRDQLDSQLKRLSVRLGEAKSDLQDKRYELNDIDDELDDMEGATNRERLYRRLMNTSQQAQNVFKETKDSFVNRQRNQVEAEASGLFYEMTNKDDVYDGLDIDKDYQLRIDVGGDIREIQEQDPSQGARQIMAYAFIAGLARSTSREAPFVIDTPTGRLDDEHKDALLSKLPEFGEQVIVLYQPRELTDDDIREYREQNLLQSQCEITKGEVPEVSTITQEFMPQEGDD